MGEFDKPNAASVEATGPHTELSRGLHELGLAGIVDFVEPLIRAGLMRDSCGATNGASTRTVRRSLKDSDMPPPGEWVSFSRCAHALRFAERQRVSLNTAAMMTGWHDASGLSRACRRLFGQRPGRLKGRDSLSLLRRMLNIEGQLG